MMLDTKNCAAAGDANSKCYFDILKEIQRALAPEVMKGLPEKLHRCTVDVLDDAKNCFNAQYDRDFGNEYDVLSKELNEIHDKILSFVPEEKKKTTLTLIDKLSGVTISMNHCNCRMSFRQGLRDGFCLAKFFESCSSSELTR